MPILGFNLAYLLAAIAGSIASGNSEFILYIVIMLVLGSVVWFADRCVVFSPLVLWGLSVWGLVHMACGLIAVPDSWPINGEHRVLYSLWLIPELLKYDHVVHTFGFGVTTLACWEGLCAILKSGGPRRFIYADSGFGHADAVWSRLNGLRWSQRSH